MGNLQIWQNKNKCFKCFSVNNNRFADNNNNNVYY